MTTNPESMLLLNKLEEPKSTQGLFELPCGYLDDEGALHKEVELSELTGNEEDLLMSRAVPEHKKMGMLIGRCIKRIGTITDPGKIAALADKLTIGDRAFLIFALRRVSLGDEYPFRSHCPNCSRENFLMANMAEMEVKAMEDPSRRIYDSTLPSGKTVRFRILTGEDEAKLSKVRKMEDRISMGLLNRIELLESRPPTLQDVRGLSIRDRDHLRCLFDEVDGGVDTTMEITCRHCGVDYEEEIDPGQPGFFFPSTTQKKSKNKFIT